MSSDRPSWTVAGLDVFDRDTAVKVYPSDNDSRAVVQVIGETALLTAKDAEKLGAAFFEIATHLRQVGS